MLGRFSGGVEEAHRVEPLDEVLDEAVDLGPGGAAGARRGDTRRGGTPPARRHS